jgi:hypothetical protein
MVRAVQPTTCVAINPGATPLTRLRYAPPASPQRGEAVRRPRQPLPSMEDSMLISPASPWKRVVGRTYSLSPLGRGLG